MLFRSVHNAIYEVKDEIAEPCFCTFELDPGDLRRKA